jgi:predicted RNA-binding protein
MNIQEELQKIHHQYGTTESANYQIQLLFDRHNKNLINKIKELEQTIENINALTGEKIEECNTITTIDDPNNKKIHITNDAWDLPDGVYQVGIDSTKGGDYSSRLWMKKGIRWME